jgi:chromate reductase, NAD(P)H dehydrogenase (quinone)
MAKLTIRPKNVQQSDVLIVIVKNNKAGMITIISGTNRKYSNTFKIAQEYRHLLRARGFNPAILSLENTNVFSYNEAFEKLESEVLVPTSHFIIISPEYNGSFPGVLKMLFDNSRSHEIWFHKKALLTGVATGRAGNLRGMDHLADVLNYLKITVHPNKLPISSVNSLIGADGRIRDNYTLTAINHQLEEFISWSDLQPQSLNFKP